MVTRMFCHWLLGLVQAAYIWMELKWNLACWKFNLWCWAWLKKPVKMPDLYRFFYSNVSVNCTGCPRNAALKRTEKKPRTSFFAWVELRSFQSGLWVGRRFIKMSVYTLHQLFDINQTEYLSVVPIWMMFIIWPIGYLLCIWQLICIISTICSKTDRCWIS